MHYVDLYDHQRAKLLQYQLFDTDHFYKNLN